MKSTRLLLVALCFSFLPSCSLIGSVLKIPASILKSAGRATGIGLTDNTPQPVMADQVQPVDSIEDAAAKRQERGQVTGQATAGSE